MQRFDLPLVDATTTLTDAIGAMRDKQVYGLVTSIAHTYRLLHLDDLGHSYRDAFDHGESPIVEPTLETVLSFAPLLAGEGSLGDTAISDMLKRNGSRYMLLDVAGDVVHLASQFEPLAYPFLSGPPFKVCANRRPHSYPPLPLSPGQTACRICGQPLI